jgi:hypothetical protein
VWAGSPLCLPSRLRVMPEHPFMAVRIREVDASTASEISTLQDFSCHRPIEAGRRCRRSCGLIQPARSSRPSKSVEVIIALAGCQPATSRVRKVVDVRHRSRPFKRNRFFAPASRQENQGGTADSDTFLSSPLRRARSLCRGYTGIARSTARRGHRLCERACS